MINDCTSSILPTVVKQPSSLFVNLGAHNPKPFENKSRLLIINIANLGCLMLHERYYDLYCNTFPSSA